MRRTALAAVVALAALSTGDARAQEAWVKDEVRLNVRTGAGTEFRILASIATGDSVRILDRGEKWTRVRTGDAKEGWVPSGFLQSEPPAKVRLERLLADTSNSAQRIDELRKENAALRERNEALTTSGQEQGAEIERLKRENISLRAGARYPEFIAGAAILLVGGVLGAFVRGSSRRQTPRIRL